MGAAPMPMAMTAGMTMIIINTIITITTVTTVITGITIIDVKIIIVINGGIGIIGTFIGAIIIVIV